MDKLKKQKKMTALLPCRKYATYDADDNARWLSGIISDMCARKGKSIRGGELDQLTRYLHADIMEHYSQTLSREEIETAISWGVCGEWGEFTGLNADRLFRFIRSYAMSPERDAAIRYLYEKRGERREKRSLADEQKANWNAGWELAAKRWQEFKDTGDFECLQPTAMLWLQIVGQKCSSIAYDWLKRVGVVEIGGDTLDTEIKAQKIATERLKKDDRTPTRIKSYADTLMLLEVFKLADSLERDLGKDVDDIGRNTPDNERICPTEE